MLRLLACCFLFLLTLPAGAQVYEHSFGVEVAPHLGGRRISSGAGIGFRQLEAQDSVETGTGGYAVGLVYESRAGRIGFTTGVRYLRTGYLITETFEDGPGLGTDIEDEVTAQYLEVPFEFNFHQDITEKDRVSFMLGAGANIHLETTTERSTTVDGRDQGTVEIPNRQRSDFRTFIPSLNAGLAFDRKLGEDWAIKLQPYFRFYLLGNLPTSFDEFNRNYYQTGVRLIVKRTWL